MEGAGAATPLIAEGRWRMKQAALAVRGSFGVAVSVRIMRAPQARDDGLCGKLQTRVV